jgi:hypothetical protein
VAIPFSIIWLVISVGWVAGAFVRCAAGVLAAGQATVVFEPFGSYWAEQTTMTGPPMPGAGVPTMTSTRRRIAPGQSVFHDVANPDLLFAAISQAKSAAHEPGAR